jgi:hypothetical protein
MKLAWYCFKFHINDVYLRKDELLFSMIHKITTILIGQQY